MKDGLIHVCFVIDESGSMWNSASDVTGGFARMIKEQKELKEGGCLVSLFKFNDTVHENYVGKDVNEIDEDNFLYTPGGCTAMNDGICTAIDKIGKWLSDMDESERPEKNLIVIMTDGYENASREFTLEQVREKIQHQTEKYNWNFTYMGTDVSDSSYTNSIMGGISGCTFAYNTRDNYEANYSIITSGVKAYRCAKSLSVEDKDALFTTTLADACNDLTERYEQETGNKIERV